MEALQRVAKVLRDAYQEGPVPPLREALDPQDAQQAYEIQAINTRFWVGAGRRIVGRKVGLTAKAVQAQLGVDQPDFGVLFADMQVEDGGRLPQSSVLQPKAEAEIAFILGSDLPNPKATREDVEAAVDTAVAAIEIVDSRIAAWKITFADTVADNGSSSHFVLGSERKKLAGLDLYTCGMIMEKNGEIASLGAGGACLGHPLNAATWLARTLAEQGDPLRKGDIVLTGALGPMVEIKPGDRMRATIGGLGSVGFSFGEQS